MIEEEDIRIINLYHEKEDFMWQLFGVDTYDLFQRQGNFNS